VKKILFLSHTVAGDVFRVGSHHLAREMSLMGLDVAHVSTPYSLLHRLVRPGADDGRRLAAEGGPRRDAFGTLHAVPRLLAPVSRLGTHHSALDRCIRSIGFQDADLVLLDQPLLIGALRAVRPGSLVYRPTDIQSTRVAAAREREVLAQAQAVVATSHVVLDGLETELPSLVVGNGVEVERFKATASTTTGSREGFVYVGALDRRFDWSAVVALADSIADAPIAIFGPLVTPPLPLPPNVTLRGPARYEDLPALLASAKVGLLPLSSAPENAGRSPMKAYEYIAAGLRVVSRRTPSLGRYDVGGAMHFYDDEISIAHAAREALASGPPGTAAVEAVEREDWSRKARTVLEFSEQALESRSRP
jgi:teichuronic acid biosynthesis glycosyltransferase TuaH